MRFSEHRALNFRTKSGYLQRGDHPSRVSKEPITVDAGLLAQNLELENQERLPPKRWSPQSRVDKTDRISFWFSIDVAIQNKFLKDLK